MGRQGSVIGGDDAELARLGKKQDLKRRFGFWSLLGFATSELIIWESVLSVLSLGFTNGGPAGLVFGYFISWFSSMSIYLVISELVSMAPIAAGQYYWVFMLASEKYRSFSSYMIGWLTTMAWIATIATDAIYAGTIVQGLMILRDASYADSATRWQGTLFSWAVIFSAIIINTVLPALLPKFEIGVIVFHVAGFIAIVSVLWAMGTHADTSFVFSTSVNGGDWPTQGLSYLVGYLGSVTLFVGADASVHICEEVDRPNWNVPRAIMLSMVFNGMIGLTTMLTTLYNLGDINSILSSPTGYPFLQVFLIIYIGSATAFNDVVSLTITGFYGSYIIPAALLLYRRFKGQIKPYTKPSDTYGNHGQDNSSNGSEIANADAKAPESSKAAELGLKESPTNAHSVAAGVSENVLTLDLAWGPFRVPGILGTINNAYACCYMVFVIFWSLWPSVNHPTAATMNYSIVVTGAVLIFSLAWYLIHARKVYKGPTVDSEVADLVVAAER